MPRFIPVPRQSQFPQQPQAQPPQAQRSPRFIPIQRGARQFPQTGAQQTRFAPRSALGPALGLGRLGAGFLGGSAGAGFGSLFGLAGAGVQAAQGHLLPAAFGGLSGIGQGLQAIPQLSQGHLGGITGGQIGSGLGTLAGLGGLGLSLANPPADPTIGHVGGLVSGGLQGASGLANLAGAPGLGSALGMASPFVGGFAGGIQGLSSLFGQGTTEREKALGGLQLAGALATPFTFGLSNLAAPLTSLVTQHLPWLPGSQIFNALFGPGEYAKKRVEASQRGIQAARGLFSGYATAGRSGTPEQLRAALAAMGGDVPGQKRGPVRSALNTSLLQALGVTGPWGATGQEFQKILNYFAEDPTRLTVTRGQELGGPGHQQGAIWGSGDVGYLNQQAAQQLQYSMASGAATTLKNQLLRFGQGPKMDELRTVLALKAATPEQIATLSPEWQKAVRGADPQFDPWAAKNPLEGFKTSSTTRIAREKQQAAQAAARAQAEAEAFRNWLSSYGP